IADRKHRALTLSGVGVHFEAETLTGSQAIGAIGFVDKARKLRLLPDRCFQPSYSIGLEQLDRLVQTVFGGGIGLRWRSGRNGADFGFRGSGSSGGRDGGS